LIEFIELSIHPLEQPVSLLGFAGLITSEIGGGVMGGHGALLARRTARQMAYAGVAHSPL
jgi:hypothetical protein